MTVRGSPQEAAVTIFTISIFNLLVWVGKGLLIPCRLHFCSYGEWRIFGSGNFKVEPFVFSTMYAWLLSSSIWFAPLLISSWPAASTL